MGFRIVIAGESQCQIFAQICLIADYLSQNLPNFCYDRIEKSVLDWENWLCKINQKNKWHHMGSPIIWKEMLMKGSNPFYIGGASEFLEYCHSYYNFDAFLTSEKFESLIENFEQFKRKLKVESKDKSQRKIITEVDNAPSKNDFNVCISGARNVMAMHLISQLLDLGKDEKKISKIFIYDIECSKTFMEYIETECSYIQTHHCNKIVKFVDKFGSALTTTDLLIIFDHIPFNNDLSIGAWLHKNNNIMTKLALTINASASRKMIIVLPNLGPACYNATILRNLVTIKNNNIFVATSDLGLEILPIVSEIAEIPMRDIFCPPVWGFVGINHLVDINTTVHKYNTFTPYNRYSKVKNSSLNIGFITPEFRPLEYLFFFDDSLWIQVAKMKEKMDSLPGMNKIVALTNLVDVLLFNRDPSITVCMGIYCDGSFGLKFNGVISQPAHFSDGEWRPANSFFLPKDAQVKLPYLEQIANIVMNLNKTDLPKIIPYNPCICKKKFFNKKKVW